MLTWLLLRAQKVVLERVGAIGGFNKCSLPGMGGGEKEREKVEGPLVTGSMKQKVEKQNLGKETWYLKG